ncbi:MAG: hypothetical protein PWP09_1212 [Thermotogota bacterium]|nr:hypothetical protein [Thermotogota bacterium]
MNIIGLCVGSSSVSYFDGVKGKNLPHSGNAVGLLKELIPELSKDSKIVVTGRKFRRLLRLPQISEVEATEIAYTKLKERYGEVEAIVSVGGENFVLYKLDRSGGITDVYTGNKCASGTGEFFLQQLRRMDIPLEFVTSVSTDEIYHLSSRCTVFCKSDCTHALNKGIPKPHVLNGLGKIMSDRVVQLAHRADVKKVMLVGGVTRNVLMLKYLRQVLDVVIPEEALYFEAFGAWLWGRDRYDSLPFVDDFDSLFKESQSSFPAHPPLSKYMDRVEFKSLEFQTPKEGDVCVLGVDVGSTTTKAVLVRIKDRSMLAGAYLRTLGDPVGAAKKCYREILKKLQGIQVEIVGLGVTGSGRKIVGLHASTEAVYNEIMAHARAAAYFDSEVDTIFEIGGQDAKYTYLVNGVAVDYAMNEACSAGTGSFLEEAAKESLDIDYTEIGERALKAKNPPNFSDQCAAFINSDIKTAIHEGISKDDICAGLVYSVCMNYLNRVKGNRPVGRKLFLQGGVCYNRAVPVAMAALTGKKVVVPPHPGLMGAYGVALMTIENIERGLLDPARFELEVLIERDVIYKGSFICKGGPEKCDRKCPISIIEIDGKRYPFGGACNKYENIVRHERHDTVANDYVAKRETLVLHTAEQKQSFGRSARIGLTRSFSMNVLMPLFTAFFKELGYDVVLPDRSDPEGWERKNAEFCFPAELSHGYLYDLLKKAPDIVFIPRIRGMKVDNSDNYNVFCPFVQSEPDWLKAAFPEASDRFLTVNLDFSNGFDSQTDVFEEIAFKLGRTKAEGRKAYESALRVYNDSRLKIKNLWNDFQKRLETAPFGVVLFGRAYNAFSSDANMGIPKKFASRGIPIITFDTLPFEGEEGYPNMYWAWGEMIIKAARFVASHERLFPVYITNFSCGPDSFIISYFRDIMKDKPSLVLELDSHTADAGIETRVEAFIDVVKSYLTLGSGKVPSEEIKRPRARIENGRVLIETRTGELVPLNDPRVKLVFPTMGEFGAQALAAAFERFGVRTHVCPPPDHEEFRLGRGNSLSKECLPLQLTLGSLIRYLQGYRDEELTVYFMPQTSGPCRFGQYNVYINLWLKNNRIDDVVTLSLNSENAYGGLNASQKLRLWLAIVVSDVFSDVANTIRVLASDRKKAESLIKRAEAIILDSLRNDSTKQVYHRLEKVASLLSTLERRLDFNAVPKVLLTGEIYVRRDEFSRKRLEEYFAEHDIVTHISPVHEWIYYTDYLYLKRFTSPKDGSMERFKKLLEVLVKKRVEVKVKKIFERTGFYRPIFVDMEEVIKAAEPYLSPRLTGEAIITIGTILHHILRDYHGIVAIGPFGCMPTRIAEAITQRALEESSREILASSGLDDHAGVLPVVYIETDGNPFTPVIENRLEAFVVRVKKLNEAILKVKDREKIVGD